MEPCLPSVPVHADMTNTCTQRERLYRTIMAKIEAVENYTAAGVHLIHMILIDKLKI
jgi:hypothetical protein